jgi:hypothetical protein
MFSAAESDMSCLSCGHAKHRQTTTTAPIAIARGRLIGA